MLMTPKLLTSLLGRETVAGKRVKTKHATDVEALKKFKEHICESPHSSDFHNLERQNRP